MGEAIPQSFTVNDYFYNIFEMTRFFKNENRLATARAEGIPREKTIGKTGGKTVK